MYKGGTNYTLQTAIFFKYAGLVLPLFLGIYSFLVEIGIFQMPGLMNSLGLKIFSLFWLILGLLQIFLPAKSKFDTIMRLIAYHLLAGSCLIFITGISSPLAICWIVLMVLSYIYFQHIGFELSVLAFFIVATIDIAIQGFGSTTSYDTLNRDLLTITALTVTSIVVLGITRAQEMILETLDKTRAQESLQRERNMTLVNNLTYAIISTDINGVIKVYNAATLNLLDTNDNLNGKHIDDVLKLTNQNNNEVSIFKELKTSKTTIKREDLDFNFPDNEQIRLEITYSPIHSGYHRGRKRSDFDGYVVIMRDITKAKSLEEERDEFISVVSHELRTPITIAEGSLSNIQMMLDKPNTTKEMLKSGVNTAHDQIIFLASMVNDLSTLSRAERGVADEAEDIDVAEFAHNLINKYTPEANKKGLHLNLDMSAKIGKVHTSRLYFEEMIQNFMTNAVKYTREGTVTVIIKQTNGDISFEFKDSGIGISKSDQARIFEKFYRSEDYRTRETGGTGLGLYVATKLARKLGTHITVTSRLNHGSTFGFKLPAIPE